MSITLESIVPVQADRDELIQLLSLLNSHCHQNEEAFASRSLAEWPQWCEDQGFRFALLKDLAHNLESTLIYPEGCTGLDPLITALGPAATTAQLLDSLDQELPQFLEGFDQLLQISQQEAEELGAQAGGSGWIKDHPVAAGAIGGTLLVVGGAATAWWWRTKQAAARDVERQLSADRQEVLEGARNEMEQPLEDARSQGEPLVEYVDQEAINKDINTRLWQLKNESPLIESGVSERVDFRVDSVVDFEIKKGLGDSPLIGEADKAENALQTKAGSFVGDVKDKAASAVDSAEQRLGKEAKDVVKREFGEYVGNEVSEVKDYDETVAEID